MHVLSDTLGIIDRRDGYQGLLTCKRRFSLNNEYFKHKQSEKK